MRLFIYLCLCFQVQLLFAQQQDKHISIKRVVDPIKVDGELKENTWQLAEKAGDFWQKYPFDSSKAIHPTEVMLSYDDDYLYVAAICYDSIEGNFVIQSLKRDFDYQSSDGFFIFIDTYSDKTNGFCFGLNPMGAQFEGLLQYGGSMGISSNWDNKWLGETKHYSDKNYWTLEMAIPFKTLRYQEDIKNWRVNFARNNLKCNETSCWSAVPRNFGIAGLAFTGEMHWEEAPKAKKGNMAIIPYAITTVEDDYRDQENITAKPNVGLDAKIAVTSALNLDLTVNPDFAQVDVDRQVTNLSRFSLFFPERRNFFLENSDIFERFGFRQIRPFFSRRIGLTNGQAVPILYGARLSGKLSKKVRIGVMNMQTEGGSQEGLEAQNYSVAALIFQPKGRSNIAGIFVNRQGFDKNKIDWQDYNRIAGIDWNIASKNNRLLGKLFFHHSFSPEIKDNAFAHASWIHYENPNLTLEWNHEYVGHNYDAQVGFVPRNRFYNNLTGETEKRSYLRLEPYISYKRYPKSSRVNNYGIDLYLSDYFDGQYQENDRTASVGLFTRFQNTSAIYFSFINNAVRLYFDQDITFSGNAPIPAGVYQWNTLQAAYGSNSRKKFNFDSELNYGNYYIGEKFTATSSVGYRAQPWGVFNMSFEYNAITMPENYQDVDFWLIGPKIELSFSKKLFFTNFIQYNTQAENLSSYTRLQWRFKPMSDLFIVYSENYLPFNLSIKNRSLAVKLVWWFNT